MEMEELRNDFSLKDLLNVFFEKFNILVVTVIVALIATYVGLKFITPSYKATVKLLISGEKAVDSPYYKELGDARGVDIVMTQSEIVKSKAVLERTVRVLALDKRYPALKKYNSGLKNAALTVADAVSKVISGTKGFVMHAIFRKPLEAKENLDFQRATGFLKKNIKVKRIIDTDVFEISVFDYDRSMVKEIANILSRSYVLFDLEQQLAENRLKFGTKHPRVLQLEDNIAKLNLNLSKELSDVEAIGPASVKIIEQAEKPEKPASPQKLAAYALVLVVSLMAGIFLIIFYGYFDEGFRSPKDLEYYVNIPLFGALSLIRKGVFFAKGRFLNDKRLFEKQLRIISDQLYLLSQDKKIKSIVFSGVDSGEGVTTVVFNLAKSISIDHKFKIAVVDCNLRAPGLHKLFGLENSPGVAEILEGGENPEKCLKKIDDNLVFLGAGKTELNPLFLFNSTKLLELFSGLKEKFDLVLIDAPFLKEYKDAYALSGKTDGVILVIDMLRAKKPIVKMYKELFGGASVIGALFNKRVYHIPGVVYRHF